uniref:Secreted protein n=2 Tax=Bursaphelenchus xylophilus TaxID=6326 RepID=A0A1I7SEY5_BURXY
MRFLLRDPTQFVTLAMFLLTTRAQKYGNDSTAKPEFTSDKPQGQPQKPPEEMRIKGTGRIFSTKRDLPSLLTRVEDEWTETPFVKAKVMEDIKGNRSANKSHLNDDHIFKPKNSTKTKLTKKSDKPVLRQRNNSVDTVKTTDFSRPITPVEETMSVTSLPAKYVPYETDVKLVDSWDKIELLEPDEYGFSNVKQRLPYRQTYV